MRLLRLFSALVFSLCANVFAQTSVADFGAQPDGILRTDGAMTAGSALLTSPSGSFSPSDAGKYIQVIGAGSGGTTHTDGVISAGSTALSSASGNFAQTDIGRSMVVMGAGGAGQNLITRIAGFTSSGLITLADPALSGVAGAPYFYGAMTLEGTIQSVQSPQTVTLSSPAQASISSAMYSYGTNYSAAFQRAVDAAGKAGGGVVNVPGATTCPSGAVCGYVISATDQMTSYAPGAVKIRYNNVSLVGNSPQTNLFCRGAWGLYTNSVAFPGQTATIRGNCLALGDNGGPQGAAGQSVSNVTLSGLHLYGMTDGNTYNNLFLPTSPPLTTTGDGWDETHKAILMWWNSSFSNITINSVSIQDFKGENIFSGGSAITGMVIENSTMTNFNGDGISLLAVDLQVLNNTISNGSNAAVENATTSTGNTAVVRQLYQGNTMSNFPREGLVVVGVDAGVSTGAVQIVNNTFSNIGQVNGSAGRVAILLGAQVGGNQPPANVTVSGNTCHDCYSFVQLQTGGNTQVTGNTVVVDQYPSGDLMILPFPMSNVVIANNSGSRTAAAAANGRGVTSVYSLDWGSPTLPWTDVSIHDNNWAFPGSPNYFFLTTANGGWSAVNNQNIIWQNDTCSGCTYPDVNHGLVVANTSPVIPPFGPAVGVTENAGPVNVTIDASKEQNGSQVTILNSGSQPITFNPDTNISISSPLTLPAGGSVQFTYSASAGKFVTGQQAGTVSINVQTAPAGLAFTVDGVSYAASQAFQWAPGSSHTLGSAATQAGSAGTQYVFGSWSDGGALSHSIVVAGAATTYTAGFTTQYQLTTSANPAAGGSVTAGGWFNAGSSIPIQASSLAGYQFSSFSGGLTGTANPQTLVLNAPSNVVASFASIVSGSYSLQAAPSSLSILQGSSGTGLIQITTIGGFSGSVALAASGLPSGVTASFNAGGMVTFAVSPTAATGTSTVTITGTSGSLSQRTTLSLSVLATPGGTVPVNLTAAWNVTGVAADGVPFSGGGLDNAGYAYSGMLLGASQIIGGIPFSFGPMNGVSAVSSATVPLPGGQFATLKVLATAANGNQPSQVFTVNYTDGTQSTFNQSVSDWFTPQNYTGETTAVTSAYRDKNTGATAQQTFLLYEYSFSLAAGKTLSSIVLPNNRNVVVLAMTLQQAALISVSLQTSPAGLTFTVDGTTYTTAQTFQWTPGGSHTLGTPAVQTSAGTQFTFSGWSDNGALSHTVTPGVSTSYTAAFTSTIGVTGNYSLSAAPGSLSIVQGTSGAALIQTTALNGFNGSVALAASGLPAGVTVSFNAAGIVTFAVASTAAAGTTAVTITGTSGSLNHSTTVSLSVLAPASGIVPINLASVYNVSSGVAADGVPFEGTGLDASGYAYSGTQLGASQNVGGTLFSIGPMAVADAVTSTTVPLPAGQFATLKLLATGVNGNQSSQNFTVNYTDGTQSNFTQSLSDWYTPQNYAGETIAATTAYRDKGTGATQQLTYLLYEYSFSLAGGKAVSSIVLPNNRNVVVLAMTLQGLVTTTAATPVNLASFYNITGLAADGLPFTGGGLDTEGYAYSGKMLSGSPTVGGIPFSLGPVSGADAVSSTTVSLPTGQFNSLKLLATAVNGNQNSQNFTVNYSDGTQSAFTQSLSDWFTPQNYIGEVTAVAMPYRDTSTGATDGRPFLLYEYSFSLAPGKSVSSIVLPGNRNVVVLAMTLN